MVKKQIKKVKSWVKGKPWRSKFVLNGVIISTKDAPISWGLRRAIAKGTYEGAEAKAVLGMVQKGDVILELGGGLGYISTLAARTSDTGKVVTIEANPAMIDQIKRVHRENGTRAEVINALAVARQTAGVSKFYVASDFNYSSGVKVDGDQRIEIDVPELALGEMLELHQPNVLIVDIEGHERELFEDCDLRDVRGVLVEVHPEVIGIEGVDKVLRNLRDKGFVLDVSISIGNSLAFRKLRAVD